MHLSWPVPGDGGSAITGYRVYRGTSAGGELAAPLASLAAGQTSYDDNAVTNATTYYYQVAAVNAIGDTRSTEKNATPQAAATAPGVPVVAATGGNATVHLSWPVPGDGGSAITGYRVYRGTSAGGELAAPLASLAAGVTSYDDNAVVNGTAYYFQVGAVNVVGETRSLEVSAVPAVVGWTPASLVPLAWFDASDAGSVTTVGAAGHVSQWDDLSGHGYHVTQATDASRPVTGVATVNARNVVRFTGSQTVTRAGVAHPQPFAVYFVGTFRAASASYEAMFDLGTSPTPGPQVGTNPANALYAYAGTDGGASTGDLNVVHSYVVVFNTTTSSIYRDGVLLASFNGGAQSVTGIRLGGTWDGNRADIDLAELVIGDAPANPTAWFDYTTTKWGTPNTAATAPGVPVVTATGGNATVHLSWTVPANGGSPITGYRVYRGTSAGGELAAPLATFGEHCYHLRRQRGHERHDLLLPSRRGQRDRRNPLHRKERDTASGQRRGARGRR